MSSTIQQCLREREQFRLRFKPQKGFPRNKFEEKVYGDESIMARMTLYKELHGHDGCVNTLYWSHGGDKLLSGSDDTMVRVWLPWEDYRMAYAIETGHTDNIFSAKFMPKSSDSVIVTAAGDSEIRVFDVNAQNEHKLRHVYTCHNDRAKRIALQDNPYEFLSCSEDGTVRHFDLRQPHICSHTPFGQRRSTRNYPRPAGTDVQEGCPAPLIDYGKFGLDLNTVSLNKTHPQYLLVAGMDDYIYLHDRRMVGRGARGAGRTRSPTMETRCVRRFTCTSENYWKRTGKHVTACKFSDANSQEFIGSWSTDGIFLFNIHDSPVEKPSEHNVQQSSRVKRRGRFNEEPFERRQSIIQCFRNDQLNTALDKLHTLHARQPSQELDEVTSEHDIGETVWILCLKAAVHLRRVHESPHERPSDDEYGEEEIASARNLMQDAESWTMQQLRSWRVLWCLAIGYWIAGGGQQTTGCEDREDWLHKAYRYAVRAQQVFESTQSRSASSSSATADSRDGAFRQFKTDVVAALRREDSELTKEEEDEELDEQTFSEDRWKWLDDMYTFDEVEDEKDDDSDDQASKPSMKRARRQSFNDTREPSYDQSTSAASRHATIGSSSDDQLFSLSEEDDDSGGDDDDDASSLSSSEASRADLSDASSELIEIEFTQDYIESDSEMSMSEGGASNSDESHLTYGTATDQDPLSIMDTDEMDTDEHSEEDTDDGEDSPSYHHRLMSKKLLENDVDLVTYRKRYFGHCNNRTVKDVNFYGLNDEYIVSGSDDGCAFVWEKATGRIVQILSADNDTVNVIQGHPFNPVMAVSGIDNTIKIFSPMSASATTSRKRYPNEHTSYSSSSRMYDLENILARNEENNRSASDNAYIPHSMLTAVTRTIQNGAELGRIREMMHENFQGDIDCRIQ